MFEFWRKWLLVVVVAVGLFGAIILIGGPVALPGPFGRGLYAPFSGRGMPPLTLNQFDSWIFGVLGATLIGWAVTMGYIVAGPFRRREPWAWRCLVISLTVWFIPDCIISIYHYNWTNTLFNSMALGAAMLPLVKTWRSFRR